MTTLDELLKHCVSVEAARRIICLQVQRKQTAKPEHLALAKANAYDLNAGIVEHIPLISNPTEQWSLYARAALENLFDFENAAIMAAGCGDFNAYHAYLDLHKLIGDPHEAQYDYQKTTPQLEAAQ
ncbi:hypothetical protein J4219_03875 [Candidatus Woesearchaeota archaeon]|nr:hypothetical protein [Candidatus Woesearchaeota archaeon]